jgi:hypothetical protein
MYESGSSCLVEHCLVTGQFQVTTQFGGLVGTAWTSTTLEMTDCLFAGKLQLQQVLHRQLQELYLVM